MKRKVLSLTLIALLVSLSIGLSALSSYAEEYVSFANKNVKNANDITVSKFGDMTPIEFDTPIKISDGRTLVPMRRIAEALHYKVDYDPVTKEIDMSYRDTYHIKMKVGSNYVFVSSTQDKKEGYYVLEKQPEVYEGRTYVPLRAVAELFGLNVHWDPKTKVIHIGGVLGGGQDLELKSGDFEIPPYYYYGPVLDEKPNGSGFIKFGFEMSCFFRGEFRNGVPNGTGLMGYITGLGEYSIMGSFKDGKLIDGSVINGAKFSFIKNSKVVETYMQKDEGYIKIANDPELDDNWIKGIQSEVNVFFR